jgi:hypothetical protein
MGSLGPFAGQMAMQSVMAMGSLFFALALSQIETAHANFINPRSITTHFQDQTENQSLDLKRWATLDQMFRGHPFMRIETFIEVDSLRPDMTKEDMSRNVMRTTTRRTMRSLKEHFRNHSSVRAVENAVEGVADGFSSDFGFGNQNNEVDEGQTVGGQSPNGTDAGLAEATKNSVQHKFKFRLNPLRAQSRIQYQGFTNADLTYDIDQGRLSIDISNPLGAANVVASHVEQHGEVRNTLGLRWDF